MTNMKIIWRNNKTVCNGRKNDSNISNHNGLSKPSHNSLTKMKGFNHRLINNARDNAIQGYGQIQGTTVYDQESSPPSQAGEAVEKSSCRVCGRSDNLRSISGCETLLFDCFRVQLNDTSVKICGQCVELIVHTHQFKELVCAAFQNPSEANSGSTKSIVSISKPKNGIGYLSGSEETFKRKITSKGKRYTREKPLVSKKSIVVCEICKQKYSMLNHVGEFICSRCKVSANGDRTASCVTCKAVIPVTAMKEHLERHTKANLKGRCRLRSLTKQPSKAQTECSSRKQRQAKLHCTRCAMQFTTDRRLEQHMRDTHGEFEKFVCHVCGKDMRAAFYLDKHMMIHARTETFECQFCGRIFKNSDAMQKHSLSLHGNRFQQKEEK